MYKEIIEIIKEEMKRKSITPATLSKKTGISKGSLSNHFNYKRKMSLKDFLLICKTLSFNPLNKKTL